eukprot:TRINITY_DN9092_c0_g1_i1.p1 TRINITY_DN9092_c0_g1~~TRINITY_DN9092_c0_g1_i1.p1  ORF type:complete len:166 (+),score=23.65 TRINITY_DN9092_c0_g1_i1:31-528(+)
MFSVLLLAVLLVSSVFCEISDEQVRTWLEMARIGTKEKSGPNSFTALQGQPSKHQPELINEGEKDGLVTFRVRVHGPEGQLHPMTPEHHISAVFVTDYSGNMVFLHEFDLTTETTAEATFSIPLEDRFIVAYEYCNLHGLFKGPAKAVRAAPSAEQAAAGAHDDL